MNIILRLKAAFGDAFRSESDLQYHDGDNAARCQSISEAATQTVMVGNFKVNLGEMAQRAARAAIAHGGDAKQAMEVAMQVENAIDSGKSVTVVGGVIRIGWKGDDPSEPISICFD